MRMDLVYSGLSVRTKARTDLFTAVVRDRLPGDAADRRHFLAVYAIHYGEKSYSSWAPVMWPIKVVLTSAIFLMLLQCDRTILQGRRHARGRAASHEF